MGKTEAQASCLKVLYLYLCNTNSLNAFTHTFTSFRYLDLKHPQRSGTPHCDLVKPSDGYRTHTLLLE